MLRPLNGLHNCRLGVEPFQGSREREIGPGCTTCGRNPGLGYVVTSFQGMGLRRASNSERPTVAMLETPRRLDLTTDALSNSPVAAIPTTSRRNRA
jgi:hypothetical protein